MQKRNGKKRTLPISVCIIAKNEADKMEEFLSRIRPYDWEIVVVDTGSTDGTREIAAKYADNLLDFKWISDFAAARNFSIENAGNDFILVLDCDEFLVNIDMDSFLQAMREHPKEMGCIGRINHFYANETDSLYVEYVERFFSRKYFHYVNPIHEQLVPYDKVSYLYYQVLLTTDHHGYDQTEEDTKAKSKRNLDILFRELEEKPEDQYTLFQIGQSYNVIREYEKALPYYEKAMSLPLRTDLEYHHIMLIAYGYVLLYTNRLAKAMELLRYSDDFGITADFHCLMGDIYLRNSYPLKAILEFIKATACDRCLVIGANSHIPTYNIGYINELLGDKEAALMHYKRCGDFPMANRKVAELTALLHSQ